VHWCHRETRLTVTGAGHICTRTNTVSQPLLHRTTFHALLALPSHWLMPCPDAYTARACLTPQSIQAKLQCPCLQTGQRPTDATMQQGPGATKEGTQSRKISGWPFQKGESLMMSQCITTGNVRGRITGVPSACCFTMTCCCWRMTIEPCTRHTMQGSNSRSLGAMSEPPVQAAACMHV
jgi:hypothetical protein